MRESGFAQHAVVFRAMLFDEFRFKQQSNQFGAGKDKLRATNFFAHFAIFIGCVIGKMLLNPLFNAFAFADVNELIVFVEQFVNARFFGQIIDRIEVQIRIEVFGVDFTLHKPRKISVRFLQQNIKQFGGCQSITCGTVAVFNLNTKSAT